MKRYTDLFIALAGSILLWAGWPVSPLNFLVFVAWIPLLYVADRVTRLRRFFALVYLHMFCWNILTTWWIWNASLPGALSAFLANSLIMCLPWLIYFFARRSMGGIAAALALISCWLAFEFLHQRWELSWPWLNLGNAFATHPEWIQWYQYTGASGGSLWILLSNMLLFGLFKQYQLSGRSNRYFGLAAAWLLLLVTPLLISRWILSAEKKIANADLQKTSRNVVIVQPNIDPYEEKFSISTESQLEKMISLSEELVDEQTTLVLWPETAIQAVVNENELVGNRYYAPVWSFLKRHSRVNLVTGINSYKVYGSDKKNASPTARFDEEQHIYYDLFNTAAALDADSSVQFYHKAKLVPGVETLPSFLNFMGQWFEDLGGISGTLGRDSERKVFIPWDNYYKVAPVICYESIYGDYITEYIRKGANVLAILTNDGWWDDTPGYKQHMNYARLRAIETRKWVLRSANTGISCFIDPLGNVINPRPWDEAASIKLSIPAGSRQTFFVRHGDLLSRGMLVAAIGFILVTLVLSLRPDLFRKKIIQP